MSESANNVPISYHLSGPFEVPDKKAWVVVGSGPTGGLADRFDGDGVVSLNAELAGIKRTTVHLVGHYEYFLQCLDDLRKPEILFFANPMAVGFRCEGMSAMNLLDFGFYAEEMGERLRFFVKEPDIEKIWRPDVLYCRDTIASTALHLLSKNGVKEVFFCGIDGTEKSERLGRAEMFRDAYRVRRSHSRPDYTMPKRYDEERAAFLAFGKHLGIKLTDLADVYA